MAKDKQKKGKGKSAERKSDSLEHIEDSAHKIWLAGLGAFSKAEKEGEKLFASLVKQGTSVEEQYREYLVGTVKKATSTTTSTIDFMEKMFAQRMAEAIARLPAPAAESMDAVVKQMNHLRSSILGLMGVASEAPKAKPDAAAKPAARKKATKKVAAKKAVTKKAVSKKVAAKKVATKKVAAKKKVSKKPAARKAAKSAAGRAAGKVQA